MILAAEIKTKIRMRKADYIHTYIDSTLMMMKAEEQNFFLQKPLLFSIPSFLQLIQNPFHEIRIHRTEKKHAYFSNHANHRKVHSFFMYIYAFVKYFVIQLYRKE